MLSATSSSQLEEAGIAGQRVPAKLSQLGRCFSLIPSCIAGHWQIRGEPRHSKALDKPATEGSRCSVEGACAAKSLGPRLAEEGGRSVFSQVCARLEFLILKMKKVRRIYLADTVSDDDHSKLSTVS